MPRINDDFLKTVFYLYRNETEASAGSKEGATCFLVSTSLPISPNQPFFVYAVTNAHVIEAMKSMGATHAYLRFNQRAGGAAHVIPTVLDQWVFHPEGDDVAAAAIGLNAKWEFLSVADSYFLTEEAINQYNIGVGDPTMTIGRFTRHGGRLRNTPAVRFGHISMMPGEPITQSNRKDYPQTSFLVETYSVSGFSGSPVFLSIEPQSHPEVKGKARGYLLGIDWGHFNLTETNDAPSGMMGVVPAWKIKELLESDPLASQRNPLIEATSAGLQKLNKS